jgi:hypothetical protein
MKVIVTGSTGLVGRALVRSLLSDGQEVTRLVRGGAQEFRAPGTKAVQWEPEKGLVNAAELEGHDAAVHLAGDPIAEGRWDDEKKRRIRESRVKGTRLLAETLAGLSEKPRVLVSASATGFYGDRGEEVLHEESASGEDFLSEVCREWEKATLAASQAGIRVVHLRIGFVLSAEGGGLPKMLTPFKLGVGGPVAGGRQPFPWVHVSDAAGALIFALDTEAARGPLNVVAPERHTNKTFTKTLGKVIRRPTVFPVPALAINLLYGEMGSTVLEGSTPDPARIEGLGYRFREPRLDAALRREID